MGLDQYLKASLHIGGWEHSDEAEKQKYNDIVGVIGVTPTKESPSLEVEVTVAYWRKANAIHKWFVDNTQDGVDECKDSHVSKEQLEELVKLCESVISGNDTGENVLPTQSGFFFGGTEYGSNYMDNLKNTVEQIKPLLENRKLEDWSFKYQASW